MDKSLKESLIVIKNKYLEYDKLLEDSSVISDIKKYKQVLKKMNQVKDVAVAFIAYQKNETLIIELQELIQSEEGELVKIAKHDLIDANNLKENILEQLKFLLLPKDPNDGKNVIVEIRGAAGGDEANIFVMDLFKIYTKWADQNKFQLKTVDVSKSSQIGASQLVFQVAGESVYSKLKFESGVHRVQRIPQTESQGRIHTSTVTVTVIPEADDEIDIEINTSDLKIDTFRASGAGGQHINTTDSAVRITHIPSGVVTQSQDGRSQIANREMAMQTLRAKLYDLELNKQKETLNSYRKLAGSGDRSEKIRTYNYPQDRVTDHRIQYSVSLKSILDGKLNLIIDNLIAKNNTLISDS